MKGSKLLITIGSFSAVIIGIVSAILDKENSWSQLHNTDYDPLLYFILGSIMITFLLSYSFHPHREKEITAITWLPKRVSIKLKNGLITTAFLFFGVMIFGVNHKNNIISDLHLIFTGLAILSGYITMLTYPTTKNGHLLANIGGLFGLIGFSLGFNFHLYSVSWSEVMAAIPLGVFIYITIRK